MLVDAWAHKHTDDPNVQEPMENEDFNEDLAAMEAAFARSAAASGQPDGDWQAVVSDTFKGAE